MDIGEALPEKPFCFVCDNENGLNRCKGCQAKKRAKVEKEAEKLNRMPGDFAFPEKLFDNAVGHFWGILDTHDYMRARHDLAQTLQWIEARAAVEDSLSHFPDMLRLNRSDNMGVGSEIPALYLRLGMDQERYDLIKWRCTVDNDGEGKLLQELVNQIRAQVASSAACNHNELIQDLDHNKSLEPRVQRLNGQIDFLFKSVNKLNGFYWAAIDIPSVDLGAQPCSYSSGSEEEMQIALNFNYDAWEETPGALSWLAE